MMELRIPNNPTLLKHIDQYAGVWAIRENAFRTLAAALQAVDLQAHAEHLALGSRGLDAKTSRDFVVDDGVAVIELRGIMTKYGSSLFDGPSTVNLRRAIRNAADDPQVRSIVLVIDSPGGVHAGTDDLAREVAKTNRRKPVVAFCEDVCASAAYWVASQAGYVVANPGCFVGGIGTFCVVEDSSKLAEAAGVTVHVIRSAPFKGAGTPGEPVTPEFLDAWQAEVSAIHQQFTSAVAAGRGISRERVEKLADGKTLTSYPARAAGLIDAVGSYDEAITEARSRGDTQSQAAQPQQITQTATKRKPLTGEQVLSRNAELARTDPEIFYGMAEAIYRRDYKRLQGEFRSARVYAHYCLANAQGLARVVGKAKPTTGNAPGREPTVADDQRFRADWQRNRVKLLKQGFSLKTYVACRRAEERGHARVIGRPVVSSGSVN